VGVVVLHFQFWPGVQATLRALEAQTLKPTRLVVVDNCSRDGSVEQLRAARPDVDVVGAGSNDGYGPGMNLGMQRLASGSDLDAFLLLTHECRLAEDCLQRLAARLDERPSVGVVGPILGHLDRPEKVWSAGGLLAPSDWRSRHVDSPDAMSDWAEVGPRDVDWVDGAALLVRREAWGQAGPFDEHYFMYCEEMDFCCRLRRRGWAVECLPAARAWQRPGPSTERLLTRNRLRFLSRNAPRGVFLRELGHLTLQTARPGNRSKPRVTARRLGLLDFTLRRWGRIDG